MTREVAGDTLTYTQSLHNYKEHWTLFMIHLCSNIDLGPKLVYDGDS
jgi:hypothetical protein